MDLVVITYLIYLALSIGLTAWVARTLFTSGAPFLVETFKGDTELASSVNRLLVVGFYLINLGYIAFNMEIYRKVDSVRTAIEALAGQIGLVLLVLGVMHFANLFVFNRIRRRGMEAQLPAPVVPSLHLQELCGDACTPAFAAAEPSKPE